METHQHPQGKSKQSDQTNDTHEDTAQTPHQQQSSAKLENAELLEDFKFPEQPNYQNAAANEVSFLPQHHLENVIQNQQQRQQQRQPPQGLLAHSDEDDVPIPHWLFNYSPSGMAPLPTSVVGSSALLMPPAPPFEFPFYSDGGIMLHDFSSMPIAHHGTATPQLPSSTVFSTSGLNQRFARVSFDNSSLPSLSFQPHQFPTSHQHYPEQSPTRTSGGGASDKHERRKSSSASLLSSSSSSSLRQSPELQFAAMPEIGDSGGGGGGGGSSSSSSNLPSKDMRTREFECQT
ncbi:hypothetical protein HK100_009460, partial [Physocladia obscura]